MTKQQAAGSKQSIIEYAITLEEQLESQRTGLQSGFAYELYTAEEQRDEALLTHRQYVQNLNDMIFRGATHAELIEVITGKIVLEVAA